MAATPLPEPIKGQADWREYEAFELENGVTVLAIHDKESKMTAMSCCVNVGAAADPRSLSGLAHFVEHMCFLGSSKYPGENEYKRYLASHGGRSNASTSMHLTNYKFEVLAEHAEKAVDIFSNFFIDPLFTSSGTVREVQAVDSENSKNLVADGRRRLQILKDLVDPEHYYSKFSTGNSKTLDTSNEDKLEFIRSALLAFHAKHYRPENFTVVIAGPQPVATLQEWISSRFSRIQEKTFPRPENMSEVEVLIADAAKDAPPYSFKEPAPDHNSPFEGSIKGSMPLLLSTKPLRSMRKLVLMFPMKSDRKIPDQSPSNFLSHLLGHEGKGSIFAALQTQGMISSLSSGARTSGPDFKLFSIDIELTEKGEEHWEEVAETVFAYCRMFNEELERESKNESKEMRRIWEEHSKLDRIFFDQTSPGGTYAYAPNLSQRVNAYGTEECLSAGSMLKEGASTFPLDLVNETAKFFTPENCLVERCSEKAWEEAEKNAKSSSFGFEKKTEQWYGVDYIVAPIAEETAKSWSGNVSNGKSQIDKSELRLPSENRYIPRSLDLCEELPEEARVPRIEIPIDPPNLLVNNKAGRLYHRLDDRYALPKSSFTLLIRNAATVHKRGDDGKWDYDGRSGLKSTMLAVIFSQAMAQETYDADLAGLYWSLSLGPSGAKLHCYGFSDRVPDLTKTVLERFLAGDFLNDAYFVSTKDRLVRGLKTFFSSRRSDAISVYYRDVILNAKDGSIDESLSQVENIDMEALRAHHKSIVENKEVFMECLFTGNVSAKTATDLFSDIDAAISTATKSSPETRRSLSYVPSTDLERRVMPQEDIELHFQSENPQEENGAVVFTYQSPVPSYRGEGLSHHLSLKSTSAVRLLCHMLREPLFDELRTKQQLGYIVSSYYERGFSARQPSDEVLDPSMVPVDFITISVLSRKLPPTDVATRIDEFLEQFRSSLHEMPESEIRDHADALSKKMLKPVQKLLTESNSHFTKIHRFSPECISAMDEEKSEPMPWKTDEDLAECIESLSRAELVETWDQIIGPANRARIVSCVYGNTFPLTNKPSGGLISSIGLGSRSAKITNDFSKLLDYRQQMGVYNNRATGKRSYSSIVSPRNFLGASYSKLSSPAIPVFGLGVIGAAGMVGWTLLRNQKAASSK